MWDHNQWRELFLLATTLDTRDYRHKDTAAREEFHHAYLMVYGPFKFEWTQQ